MSSVSSPHITVIGGGGSTEQEQPARALSLSRLPEELGELAAQEIFQWTRQIARALDDPGQCDGNPARQAEYLVGCLVHADLQRQGWLFIMGYVLSVIGEPERALFQLVGSGYDSVHDLIVSEGLNPATCDEAMALWRVWSLYEGYTTIQEVLRLPTPEHLRVAVRLAADINRQAKQEREHHSAVEVERLRQEAMSRAIGDLIQTPYYDLRDKRASLGTPAAPGATPPQTDEDEDEEPLFAHEEEPSAPAPYRPPVIHIEAQQCGRRLQLVFDMDLDPDQVDRIGTLLWDMGAGFNIKTTWGSGGKWQDYRREPATLKPHELAKRMREAFGYYTPPPLDDDEENEGTLD